MKNIFIFRYAFTPLLDAMDDDDDDEDEENHLANDAFGMQILLTKVSCVCLLHFWLCYI